MPSYDLMRAVAEAVGVAAVILALGRWGGGVSSALREIQGAQREQVRTTAALGRKLDSDRTANTGERTKLWIAHTQNEGRIVTLEMHAGMPPPWKRTQPIKPVDPAAPPPDDLQDMFRKDDID